MEEVEVMGHLGSPRGWVREGDVPPSRKCELDQLLKTIKMNNHGLNDLKRMMNFASIYYPQ